MRKDERNKKILGAISRFLLFFLLVAFVITCSLMLFLTVLSETMGLTLTSHNLSKAAKLTMLNVVLISLAFSTVDLFRRKWTVQRPVKKITEATAKMMRGDFNIRIKPISKFAANDSFNEIIDCINRMAEELSGIETLRTDFIANVSHEIKTPLSVIQNYGKLLQGKDLSEQERLEYAKSITDASRRLADMITNILKLNRLENQQIYPHVVQYDLGEQLCECLLQFESIWEARKIEIETKLAENVLISADNELLSLVWNNLFSNAFKFTEKGGHVSLSLEVDEQDAIVKISDTGCGISPEVGAHMFDQFYQGDTSHATEGNGLGLALVKRVIDLTEGEISVESTVGIGTVFTVRIRRNA